MDGRYYISHFSNCLKEQKNEKCWLDMVKRQNFEPNYQSDCVQSILLDSKDLQKIIQSQHYLARSMVVD